MEDKRIIKRYTNRKLYDTYESEYVTLGEVAELIKKDFNVQVIDNKTKNDITDSTRKQIVAEAEKTAETNSDMLLKVIKSKTGTLSGYIQELEQSKLGRL